MSECAVEGVSPNRSAITMSSRPHQQILDHCPHCAGHRDGLTWWDRDPEGSKIPGFMERLLKYPSNKLNASYYEGHLVNSKLNLQGTLCDVLVAGMFLRK